MRYRSSSSIRHALLHVSVSSLLALAFLTPSPAFAIEEGLQELKLPPLLVEKEIKPELSSELPPPTYPLEHVEQLPFHGAWHEFVNVTTGGLVFRMADIKLPGRMPIDFGRVYDSKVSNSLPPPPPGRGNEARWTEDLGPNWILGYTAYILPEGFIGYQMATTDGDVIIWEDQGDGTYLPQDATASKHMILETNGPYVLEETQTDGTKWTFTFGVASAATHALTKIEDRSGNCIEMLYGAGRLLEIRNSDGASLTLHRDNNNPALFPVARVTKVDVTAAGDSREVLFDYDTTGRLTRVTDVRGKDWTFAYNGSTDKLTSANDPLSNTYLSATYDAQYRISTYEAQNGPWTFTYSGMRTNVDDAFSNRWIYEHLGDGITAEINEPEGGVHTLTFDTKTDPSGYVDPEGVTVGWVYNADHLPASYTPAGVGTNSITYAYDADEHWVDSVTGLDGGVTTFTRDAAGRVLTEQKPDGGQWTATYDGNTGDRLTLTLPLGNVQGGSGYDWSFDYDSLGQITEATDPTGRVFEFEYTDAGDLWKFRRPDHENPPGTLVMAEWVYTRDAAGKITGITDPLLNTWTRTYDDAGRLASIQGPVATHVDYGYDARHRITTATVVDGVNDPVTTYGYDAAGRLTTKTLPNGSVWTYGYDTSSRLTSVTDPLLRVWTYGRDDAGRVTSITHPGGQVVTMTRDTAGRLATRTIPGGRVETFSYDVVTGRITQAETDLDTGAWIGTLDWAYDNMGRPDSVKTSISEGATSYYRELQFGYDVNGNRTSLTSLPSGESITYVYDSLDRLTSTDSDIYDDWVITHDAVSGHRTGASTTGRWKSWVYDLAGRMIHQQWDWPGQMSGDFTYSYDGENRITSAHDVTTNQTKTTYWGALGLPSLATVVEGGNTVATTFLYDDVGQVTNRTRTDGTEVTDWVFDWDSAGRLVYARQNDDIRTYTWSDTPADAASPLNVWRVSTDPRKEPAEILYGYDGRVHEINSYDLSGASELIAEYRWAPLMTDIALEATKLHEDDSYSTTRMIADIGGYYGEVASDFTDQALATPITGIDRAAAALAVTSGSSLPNAGAPFGRGSWKPSLEMRSDLDAVAELVTGLVHGRKETGLARKDASTEAVALGTLAHPVFAPPDVTDDWLAMPLLGRDGMEGGEASLTGYAASLSTKAGGPHPNVLPAEEEDDWNCWRGFCGPNIEFECLCDGGLLLEIGADSAGLTNHCCAVMTGGGPPVFTPDVCSFGLNSASQWQEARRNPDLSPGGVSLVNGEYIKSVTDLSVFGGATEVPFTRTYRSRQMHLGGLGYRWMHNWEERIEVASDPEWEECGNVVRWVSPNGVMSDFWFKEDGTVEYPEHSLHRITRWPGGIYDIRSVDGIERRFEGIGNVKQLTSISQGDNYTQLSYVSGKLDRIVTNGVDRLQFYYQQGQEENTDLIRRVENVVDPTGDWVEFTYTDCGELEEVALPATTVGDGGPAKNRLVTYTYYNLNEDDCLTTANGMHLLETTSIEQFDPLGTADGPQRTLTTRYYETPYGANNVLYWRAHWQCIGDHAEGDCDQVTDDAVDLVYLYDFSQYPSSVAAIVTDRRVDGATILDRHTFIENRLRWLTEDEGGLGRVSTYLYDANGLPSGVSHADGSKVQTTFIKISGIWLPETTRVVPSDPSKPDLVTHRTYEGFKGLVKTITGPEAFPDGVLPPSFDPNAAGIKEYTQFFVYDFEEGAPPHVQDICTDWNILPADCPPVTPLDINGDAGDDLNWFGNPIKVYRWLPEDVGIGREQHELVTVTAYQLDGRPRRTTRPDGVSTEYSYYDSPGSSGVAPWDWRNGDLDTDADSDDGPLARTTTISSDGLQTLETTQAWSSSNHALARQGPQGVRQERTLAESGRVLAKRVVCDSAVNPLLCVAPNDVLRTTHYTYDLRGRQLREQIFDGDIQPGELPKMESQVEYDDRGRPITVTVDPAGGATAAPHLDLVTRTHYDGRGRVTKTVSPEGRVACYTYDNLDRLKATRRRADLDAGGSSCGTSVDDIVSTREYDYFDRLIMQREGSEEPVTTYFWYDAYGRREYSSDGQPPGVPTPLLLPGTPFAPPAATWYAQTSYDDGSRPSRSRFYGGRDSATEGFMRVGWQEYDELGRPLAQFVGVTGGYIDSGDANSAEPPVQPTSISLLTSRTYYNDKGQLHESEDDYGRRTNREFDAFGRQFKTVLPIERVCEDDQSISCLEQQDCVNEGAAGPCVDKPGGTRDNELVVFDDFGRQERVEVTVHDPNGAARIRAAETHYDQWGRVVRSVDAPGGSERVLDAAYDYLDRVTLQATRWETLASPAPTQLPNLDDNDRASRYHYDQAGRLWKKETRKTNADSWIDSQVGYDGDGLTTWLKDAEQNTTDWVYDPLGHLTKMLYPANGGGRQTVEYPEHEDDRPTQTTLREDDGSLVALHWNMDYDVRGRLDSIVADATDVDGLVFEGTTSQGFAYDDLGLLILATDTNLNWSESELRSEFTYDSLGRTTEENQPRVVDGLAVDHRIQSSYDRQGVRTQLLFPDAFDDQGAVQSSYSVVSKTDSLGRLATILAPDDPSDASTTMTALVEYEYQGSQVWSRRYRNGAELRMFDEGLGFDPWDDLGRPTALRTVNSHDPAGLEQVITDFRFGYDRIGNLSYEQRKHEPVVAESTFRTRAYTTDLLGRLETWREGDMSVNPVPSEESDPAGLLDLQTIVTDLESWTLDDAGNWDTLDRRINSVDDPTMQFPVNPLNQYTQVDPDANTPDDELDLEFDWLGQMRQDDSKKQRYVWDAFGRLSKIEDISDPLDVQLVATYRYDALNRRVEKFAPNETDEITRYYYDGWRAIEERTLESIPEGGEWEPVRARYGFGRTLDGVLWMDRDVAYHPVTLLPDPSGVTDNVVDARLFAHHDRIGSIAALTEDSSTPGPVVVVERFSYSAYGEVTAWWDPTWSSTEGYGESDASRSRFGLPYLYTGQRLDSESGLHYFKNRYHDPLTGRFLNRDPSGLNGGLNLYQYANTSPHMFSDPLGLIAYNPSTGGTYSCGYLCSGGSSSTIGQPMEQLPPGINNWSAQAVDAWLAQNSSLHFGMTSTAIAGPGLDSISANELEGVKGIRASLDGGEYDSHPFGYYQNLSFDLDSQLEWQTLAPTLIDTPTSHPGSMPGGGGVGGFLKEIGIGAALIGAGFIPGVGDVMDVYDIARPGASGFERTIGAVSITANLWTAGLLPNAGPIMRGARHIGGAVAGLFGGARRAARGVSRTVDPATGRQVGRFIGRENGPPMIEPVGGSTVPAGRGGVDTHTLYPSGSNYQRLNPQGHPGNPTPHGHGHLEGTGPGMAGQGPSIDPQGNVVPWNSPDAHWPVP